MMGRGTVRNM